MVGGGKDNNFCVTPEGEVVVLPDANVENDDNAEDILLSVEESSVASAMILLNTGSGTAIV